MPADCSPSPTNIGFSEDNTQSVPDSRQPLQLWQRLALTHRKSSVAPYWPISTTGTRPCPRQAKRAIADSWSEGKHSSAPRLGHRPHTQETPLKSQALGHGGHCSRTGLFFRLLLSRAGDVENRAREEKRTTKPTVKQVTKWK